MAELNAEVEGSQASTSSLEIATNAYVPLSTMNLVFIRLDSQAAQLGSSRVRRLLSPALDDKERGYQAEIPLAFSSIEQARNMLDHIWADCDRGLQGEKFADEPGGPTPTLEISLKLVRDFSTVRLRQWSQAFDNFFRLHPHEFDDDDQEFIHIVKIHRILIEIFFGMNLVHAIVDEKFWDNYYVEFDTIMTHATAVAKRPKHTRSKGTPKPAFSLDTGIILPLYFVATKCRHPTIRRKAIALLKSTPRQEGVLNSMLTGRVAERLVEIEEEGLGHIGCAEDIPHWVRLAGADVKFDPSGRRAFLQYIRNSSEGSGKDTVEEWIEW